MNIVTLNVGGHIYTTARSTLTRYPDSMLGAMFGGDLGALRDDQGRYFIDRNGRMFEHVLNFLRTGQLVLPEDFKELPLLEIEADFYQIQPLIEALGSYKARLASSTSEDLNTDVVVVWTANLIYTCYGGIFFIASSTEVEEMVNGLINTLPTHTLIPHRPNPSGVAVLLKRIQDNGFSLQGYAAAAAGGGYLPEHSWVLVRKNTQNSSDSVKHHKA